VGCGHVRRNGEDWRNFGLEQEWDVKSSLREGEGIGEDWDRPRRWEGYEERRRPRESCYSKGELVGKSGGKKPNV